MNLISTRYELSKGAYESAFRETTSLLFCILDEMKLFECTLGNKSPDVTHILSTSDIFLYVRPGLLFFLFPSAKAFSIDNITLKPTSHHLKEKPNLHKESTTFDHKPKRSVEDRRGGEGGRTVGGE